MFTRLFYLFLENIKQSIRDELYRAIYKLLLGGVLSICLIYFIFQFSKAFQTFSDLYQNGYTFELIGFGLAILFCFVALRSIFQIRQQKPVLQNTTELDLQKLTVSFTTGLVSGYNSGDAARQSYSAGAEQDMINDF